MTRPKLFIHGVPDSPAVWRPLIAMLGDMPESTIHTPALPGFTAPPPKDFTPTKDNYADWLVKQIEMLHATQGPIDIIGHDWGAILALRAASLRPKLIHSWVISGAVIHPDYRGHVTAKRWATPLLGELIMALASPSVIKKTLIEEGLPEDIAAEESSHWNKSTRRCILGLYRSAKGLRFTGDWLSDLACLPAKGLVLWGENDPYVDARFGESFAAGCAVPFHIGADAGHWMIAQRPAFATQHLKPLWAG